MYTKEDLKKAFEAGRDAAEETNAWIYYDFKDFVDRENLAGKELPIETAMTRIYSALTDNYLLPKKVDEENFVEFVNEEKLHSIIKGIGKLVTTCENSNVVMGKVNEVILPCSVDLEEKLEFSFNAVTVIEVLHMPVSKKDYLAAEKKYGNAVAFVSSASDKWKADHITEVIGQYTYTEVTRLLPNKAFSPTGTINMFQ